jgi:hypothetical protein
LIPNPFFAFFVLFVAKQTARFKIHLVTPWEIQPEPAEQAGQYPRSLGQYWRRSHCPARA